MSDEHFNNYKKLVIFLEIILAKRVVRSHLTLAQQIIESFVSELESLYSSHIMLSGTHELLHLVDNIDTFGHLNPINCFPFEELNRKLVSYIHGFDLIGEKFIKIFSTGQLLSKSLETVSNDKLKESLDKYPPFKTSNVKQN